MESFPSNVVTLPSNFENPTPILALEENDPFIKSNSRLTLQINSNTKYINEI